MRWPWQPPEVRETASYTDAVVTALLQSASTPAADAAGTAALEACAGLYASAFAGARVTGASPVVSALLTPPALADMARDLIRSGVSIWLLEVDDGGLSLHRAGAHDLSGGHRAATWVYRLDLEGPSGPTMRTAPADSVVHLRYASDARRPWAGLGPMALAHRTGALAGRLESGLADEAAASPALLLPVPSDGGDGTAADPLARLKGDVAAAKGRALLVETTAAGWGDGPSSAPRQDWRQQRLGADWPDVLRSTRRDVAESVAAACGVPPALLSASAEGTSMREALRRWAHVSLEPLGRIVAAELADKLDAPGLSLDFDRLMASDWAGRARAVGVLVKAGMALDTALATVAGGAD